MGNSFLRLNGFVNRGLNHLFVPHRTTVDVGNQEAVSGERASGPIRARRAHVVNSDFVKSSVRPDDCPCDGHAEFALIAL
jgi:GTP-binding protein